MKKLLIFFTLFSSFCLTAQINNYSLEFDGIDDYVEIPNSNSNGPSTSSNFSVSFWSKSITGGNLISLYDNLNAPNSNFLVSSNTTDNSFSISGNGTNSFTVFPNTALNDWTYVSVVFINDGTTNVYVNGALLGTSILNLNNNISSVPFTIGKVSGPIPGFSNGLLDNIEFWNTALTQPEIQNYMVCSPIGSESGLIGFWNFEEGTGNTVTDLTSNANDGTLNGGVTWGTDVPTDNCTLNVHTTSYESNINIYPNPANDQITIDFGNLDNVEDWNIKIINILGQEVLSQPMNTDKINVSELSKGVYIIRISDGINQADKKFIKN